MSLTVNNPEREAQDAREVVGQFAEQQQLRARIYGKDGRVPNGDPAEETVRWRDRAATLSRTLNEIEVLPPVKAAQSIRQRQEEAEARRVQAQRASAGRAKKLAATECRPRQCLGPERDHGIEY